MKTIDFNRNKLQELKRAWNWAICTGKDQFEFEGHTILVSYAKYLIEYLESQGLGWYSKNSKNRKVRDFPLESPNEHNERA